MQPAKKQVTAWATELLEGIKNILREIGIREEWVDETDHVVYSILILLLAFLLAYLSLLATRFFVRRILRFREISVLRIMYDQHFFLSLSRLIPPIFILLFLPLALSDIPKTLLLIQKICWIYFTIVILTVLDKIVTIGWHTFTRTTKGKNRPLKGVKQIMQVLIYFFGAIVIVSILINKSPATLIGGLSAFAAVLMLIFKDLITGVVAGVQISSNDMIREGDWIEVPSTAVNGTVTDISLVTVKIQCWNNTTAMIPPYTLVSAPFVNWRGMADSGGRRIQRSYLIDTNSIHLCSDDELEQIKNSVPLINPYITEKQQQSVANRVVNTNNPAGLVDGTIETNAGLFRAYMTLYLKQHPFINQDLTLMVRSLEPTGNGFPIEVYCFSANKEWVSYESIQAEVMEHFVSTLPLFGLYAFQNPSGRDFVNSALIVSDQPVSDIVGLPWNAPRQVPPLTGQADTQPTPPATEADRT